VARKLFWAIFKIKEGDEVHATGRILEVSVSDAILGRVVNAIGTPIDGKGAIKTQKTYPIEKVAPGVVTRWVWTSQSQPESK
jgi:F-type H+-transporting ATPase subunit alpha